MPNLSELPSWAVDAATPDSREICDFPALCDRSRDDLRAAPIAGDAILGTALDTLWKSQVMLGAYRIVVDIVYDELKP